MKYPGLEAKPVDYNFHAASLEILIRKEQRKYFTSEISYLENRTRKCLKTIPSLVSKLNLFLDYRGVLRLKSKFDGKSTDYYPALLPKNSELTNLLVLHTHEKCGHGGTYRF